VAGRREALPSWRQRLESDGVSFLSWSEANGFPLPPQSRKPESARSRPAAESCCGSIHSCFLQLREKAAIFPDQWIIRSAGEVKSIVD
jgi:hypothetical protein